MMRGGQKATESARERMISPCSSAREALGILEGCSSCHFDTASKPRVRSGNLAVEGATEAGYQFY